MLLVLGFWLWLAFVRLQQGWLQTVASEALDAARAAGLELLPTSLRQRVVARRPKDRARHDGGTPTLPLRVEWRTGLRGPTTVVITHARTVRLPLVTTAVQLEGALASVGSDLPPSPPDGASVS